MPTTNQAIASAQRILKTIEEESFIAELINRGDPRIAKLSTFNQQNIIRTQSVTAVWKRIGRQVLAMHPEVVEEVKVASSDKIPGEVLRTLPYMNPMVVFADPPVFKTWLPAGVNHPVTGLREDKMRLLGFLTYGSLNVRTDDPNGEKVRIEQRILPTNDSEANRFGMMLVFEALDELDRVVDVEFNSMSLFFDRIQTLSETVDDLMERFHWDNSTGQSPENRNNTARKWMRQVMSTVVGSLFYLCSTTLEAEKVPAKTVAKRVGRNISRRPFSLYKVGWTTGGALTRYRQQNRTDSTSEQSDITHQQDPQHRRSHFKMQPCGKGLQDRKLIFVSAYWTHLERLGIEGVNTARAVPRVNGKGAARESQLTAMEVR